MEIIAVCFASSISSRKACALSCNSAFLKYFTEGKSEFENVFRERKILKELKEYSSCIAILLLFVDMWAEIAICQTTR